MFLDSFWHTYMLHPLRGNGYQWWSGAGSDLGEIVLIGGLVTLVRRGNCHVKGCYRLGHHPVDGTPYKVCRKHHPTVPAAVTAKHVAEAHRAAHTWIRPTDEITETTDGDW